MNVFENLVEELKDENLLETTVNESNSVDLHRLEKARSIEDEQILEVDSPQISRPKDECDFFRKRAMDEVSSLQMVEHVLSGVEREHEKISPEAYDDLKAKKALHKFMQVSNDLKSPEHADAEFELRQETENWNFALYERDRKISVSNIRRFCEDSRPVLSSQALISLARFYRNSFFSEDVRSKFDFVMTRLFSRETGDDKRGLLFPKDEMILHISTLYANWSSVALFSSDEDQPQVSRAISRFQDFVTEVERAVSFDELLKADFFGKVRLFKEEASEMFYTPAVVSAAIDCNIKIGNKYVDLIQAEKKVWDAARLEIEYGLTYDQVVSDTVGKTLLLSDLLEKAEDTGVPQRSESVPAFSAEVKKDSSPKRKSEAARAFEIFGINKWMMAVAVLAIAISTSVYFWAEKAGGDNPADSVSKVLEIDDAEINRNLHSISATSETLYGVAQPPFEAMNEHEKKAFLGKVLNAANDRNIQKVTILNSKGRTIAFVSKDRLQLFDQ